MLLNERVQLEMMMHDVVFRCVSPLVQPFHVPQMVHETKSCSDPELLLPPPGDYLPVCTTDSNPLSITTCCINRCSDPQVCE